MAKLRWARWLGALVLLLTTHVATATVYSSTMLSEANSLVDIVPKQSKQLASNYLAQRTLSDQTEQSPSSVSRDESDSRTRSQLYRCSENPRARRVQFGQSAHCSATSC